jgi:predicted dehydrogenase
MLQDKPGNVVVLSGNNRRKAEYIKACVDAGLNVLADKPMCIDGKGYELLKDAFASAEKNGAVLYDVMTERSEITTILQRELVHNKEVFGDLLKGTPEKPSVVQESVHHFFKYVAGNPIKRPGWYFDTTQQGEGIVDVTTHLVDLVMWGSFPQEPIDISQVEVKSGRRWPTLISREDYKTVTRLDDFPPFLKNRLDERGLLPCYANGEIIFTVKGIHARVAVTWNYQAPEGAKDTHYSIMRGTRANIFIEQGTEQNYRPELYVEASDASPSRLANALKKAVADLQTNYPGVELKQQDNLWHILIPDKYRIGHEAHFAQVMDRYLKYLIGKLPAWEMTNMITKHYVTTRALEVARQ